MHQQPGHCPGRPRPAGTYASESWVDNFLRLSYKVVRSLKFNHRNVCFQLPMMPDTLSVELVMVVTIDSLHDSSHWRIPGIQSMRVHTHRIPDGSLARHTPQSQGKRSLVTMRTASRSRGMQYPGNCKRRNRQPQNCMAGHTVVHILA